MSLLNQAISGFLPEIRSLEVHLVAWYYACIEDDRLGPQLSSPCSHCSQELKGLDHASLKI